MNLIHLKYAVEVSKTKSISRAAENLYMGQPNLSRAIKELEDSLGITVFDRSSKGIRVTAAGEEFLQYARRILNQVDEIEAIYKDGNLKKQKFSVCTAYAAYISKAFSKLAAELDRSEPIEFFYKETTTAHAINNVANGEYNLGVVRFQAGLEMYYSHHFESKGIVFEKLAKFKPKLVVSANSAFAKRSTVSYDALESGIEILHGDPYVPFLPCEDSQQVSSTSLGDKKIYIFERDSQIALLRDVENSFMFCSPLSSDILKANGLVQLDVTGAQEYIDAVIYRKGYILSQFDLKFVENAKELQKEMNM